MPVTFHIPGALRELTGGHAKVEIEAAPKVLDEALKALWMRYPAIRDRIANEQGHIREHINVFVGNEDIRYTGGLATSIPAGAEISIIAAVSGGLESMMRSRSPSHCENADFSCGRAFEGAECAPLDRP